MKWVKASLVGLLGSLLMFILMQLAMGAGMAPFEMAPSAAFLEQLGLPPKPLALVVHFGYGLVWSVIFVALWRERANWLRGLLLAGFLWLVMMLVFSPIIGWGVFGANAPVEQTPVLQSTGRYVIASAVLHIVYGLTIGILNPLWIRFAPKPASAAETRGDESPKAAAQADVSG